MNPKQYIEKNQKRFLDELFTLLRIPSISSQSEHKPDMIKCAERWRELILAAGADKCEVMPAEGNPIVYGEKIAELAEGETSIQMKNSIKALLGINVIDLLENDLTRIIKRMDNEKSEDYDGVYVEDLRHIKNEKEDILKQIDDEIAELEKQPQYIK